MDRIEVREDQAAGGLSWPLRRTAVFALELVIALQGLALAVIFAMAGAELDVLPINQAARPILVLLVLVPLRLTIDDRSWLLDAARRWMPAPSLAGLRSVPLARVPPAVVDSAFALVVTRAASLAVGFLANLLFTAPSRVRGFEMPFENRRFAEVFAAWDSGWYFDIASRGYYFNPDGQSSIAFFPLYPMLMRALAWPFGSGDKAIWIAGIVVSYVAFALALVAIHQLTERLFGDREIARRTVLYVAIFPFSIFFSRVYAESVFLLTSVLAVSRAYDNRWWQAGAWGALATLSRPNGMVIGLPLALMALAGRPAARELARRSAGLLLIPAALAGYSVYVYTLSGDPLGWLSAQAQWGYSLGHPPWEQLTKMIGRLVKYGFYDYFFVSPMAPYRLFHGTVALTVLALVPAIFKRLGVAMGAYVLASVIIPLTANALEGVGRYCAVLFPVFMLAGSFKSPRVHEAILIVWALFLALFVCLFVTDRPIY